MAIKAIQLRLNNWPKEQHQKYGPIFVTFSVNKVVDEFGIKAMDRTWEKINYSTIVVRIYSKETEMAIFKQNFFKKPADIGKNMKFKIFDNTATAETVA